LTRLSDTPCCTSHIVDPSGETEEFDNFISICPEDIREGILKRDGKAYRVAKLFDGLAIDLLGQEYRRMSTALMMKAVMDGEGKRLPIPEVVDMKEMLAKKMRMVRTMMRTTKPLPSSSVAPAPSSSSSTTTTTAVATNGNNNSSSKQQRQ
jgi:hypothetical protein